jgi:hypothetical protein
MPPPFTTGWVHNLEVAPATSDASQVIGVAVGFSTVAVLFTILRLGVRYKTLGRWGLDDVSIAASTVSNFANCKKLLPCFYTLTPCISFSALVIVP